MILPYYSEGEKRNFNRMKVDVAAQLQVGSGNLTGMCRDLSGGGMLVELDKTLSIGTSVEVIIKAGGEHGRVLHAETTVARILSPAEQEQKCLLGLKIERVLN